MCLFFTDEVSVNGPALPFTISEHCMVKYDDNSIYIIGGKQNGVFSNKTWIMDPRNNFQLREGPSLKYGNFNFFNKKSGQFFGYFSPLLTLRGPFYKIRLIS